MAVINRFEYSGQVVARMQAGGYNASIFVRMTDSVTGLTKTGVAAVGDGSDIEISTNGVSAFATASSGGRTITELGTLGIYKYTFTGADVPDAGQLAVKFTIAGTESLIVVLSPFGQTLAAVNTLDSNSITATSLDASAAQEIADALLATTMAELAQAAPDTTPTVAKALMLLYMALRNASTATATERAIYDNAGTKIAKATLTDNGVTFTQGKLGSGA